MEKHGGQKLKNTIELPYGGAFSVESLVEAVRQLGGTIILGNSQCKLTDHVKPYFFDYWLRTNGAANADTKQVIQALVDDLVATGRFERIRAVDQNTKRYCGALRLT
jgi:hypothetical protein